MTAGQTITLRLTIRNPVPGVAYSLQNKKSEPVTAIIASAGPISFDVPVRVAPGPRYLGEFVRSEGPERRFVYIAIGGQAGQPATDLSRRAKIDIHTLPHALLAEALAGKILEAELPSRDKDGGPACATLRPLSGWHAAN